MGLTKEKLKKRLVAEIQDLPEDELLAVLRFVQRLGTARPKRGSAEAILRTLDRAGPLRFDPGELDALLADIERIGEMDLEERG